MNKVVSHRITYLNFCLAIFIVGIHGVSESGILQCNSILAESFYEYFQILFDSATGAFFFLSGLLTFRGGKEYNYLDLLKKRFFSLIIPYLIYNSMACMYSILLDLLKILIGRQNSFSYDINLEFFINQIIFKEANPPMWFIPVLFVLIILYPIILRIVKHKTITILLIFGIIIFNYGIGIENGYSTVRYWLPEYLIGAFAGYHFKNVIFDREHIFSYRKKYCTLFFYIILLLFSIELASLFSEFYYLYRLVSIGLLYLIFDLIASPSKEPKWIFKTSFFIYGTHIMFISPIQKIYYALFGYRAWGGAMANVILPLTNVFFILLFAWFLRTFFPKFWGICTGGRG